MGKILSPNVTPISYFSQFTLMMCITDAVSRSGWIIYFVPIHDDILVKVVWIGLCTPQGHTKNLLDYHWNVDRIHFMKLVFFLVCLAYVLLPQITKSQCMSTLPFSFIVSRLLCCVGPKYAWISFFFCPFVSLSSTISTVECAKLERYLWNPNISPLVFHSDN